MVLFCFYHRRTKAQHPPLASLEKLESRCVLGCRPCRRQASSVTGKNCACQLQDESLAELSAIVSSGGGVSGGGGLTVEVKLLPETLGVCARPMRRRQARPAAQWPGVPSGRCCGLDRNRQHIRASGLGRVCQGTRHGLSPPPRSQTCPHPDPSTDSRVGSGVNTGPSTDKPPNGGFPFYLKLQTVCTLWGTLLATQGVKSVSRKHSLHSRFVLNQRAAQPEGPWARWRRRQSSLCREVTGSTGAALGGRR